MTSYSGVWNSFVIAAQPGTLAELIAASLPALGEAFAPVRGRLGTPWEDAALRTAYGALRSMDFSRQVLQRAPARLAVLPVSGLEWNDLGDPSRVQATRQRLEAALVSA